MMKSGKSSLSKEKYISRVLLPLFVFTTLDIHSIPVPGTIIFLLKAHNRLFVQSVRGVLYEVIDETLLPLETFKDAGKNRSQNSFCLA